MFAITELLDNLEAFHGPQAPNWPTDPYLFLVWWHCGYPASDLSCARGWESLTNNIGVDPGSLLASNPKELAAALKPGGMVPELRALRLREIAERVHRQFSGDLLARLKELSIAEVRAALKKFPGISDPGADRILLFAGISPVAAVPSNCPHVLARIQAGRERENYGRTYHDVQEMIASGTPAEFDARSRAYLLLKCHGQLICKRTNPKCNGCPIATSCAFFAGKTRGRG